MRRKLLGVYDLDWSWPVEHDALGLSAKLQTRSGTVHLQLPALRDASDRELRLPRDFLQADRVPIGDEPVTGRLYDNGRFRVHALGITIWCPLGHESVRVDELRNAFAEIDQWIGWWTTEPPGVEERTHTHLVDLWSPALGAWRTASHQRFEYAGSGGQAASGAQLADAISSVSAGVFLPLPHRLWCEARAHQAKYEVRTAVVTAATSAEVSVETALHRALAPTHGPEHAASEIRSASGLVEKVAMLRGVSQEPVHALLPSDGTIKHQVAGVRNRAAHAGIWPTLEETRLLMALSREIILATQSADLDKQNLGGD